jgi:hypothetical protein
MEAPLSSSTLLFLQHAPTHSMEFEDVVNPALRYLFEIADYGECLNIVEIGISTCDDEPSWIHAHLLNTRASAYYELNKLKPSREAIEAAIEIREQLLSEYDPEVAISFANLGNVEAAEGI